MGMKKTKAKNPKERLFEGRSKRCSEEAHDQNELKNREDPAEKDTKTHDEAWKKAVVLTPREIAYIIEAANARMPNQDRSEGLSGHKGGKYLDVM